MRFWPRRKSRTPEIMQNSRVGIYLVPGYFRVIEISYNTAGEATIRLLKEELFNRSYRTELKRDQKAKIDLELRGRREGS